MCLITNQEKPLIAEEDITVYKILSKKLEPVFSGFSFQYQYGVLNETTIKNSLAWSSFDSKDEIQLNEYLKVNNLSAPMNRSDFNKPSYSEYGLKCFGQGFHSALNISRLDDKSYYMFECTIPKGSQYYTNFSDLAVSNKIIINKKIA